MNCQEEETVNIRDYTYLCMAMWGSFMQYIFFYEDIMSRLFLFVLKQQYKFTYSDVITYWYDLEFGNQFPHTAFYSYNIHLTQSRCYKNNKSHWHAIKSMIKRYKIVGWVSSACQCSRRAGWRSSPQVVPHPRCFHLGITCFSCYAFSSLPNSGNIL